MFISSKRILIPASAVTIMLGVCNGQFGPPRQSLTEDWTDQQVIHTESTNIWTAFRNQRDPRYIRRMLRNMLRQRIQQRLAQLGIRTPNSGGGTAQTTAAVRDWNTTLGTGSNTMSLGHMVAKFVFDVNQPASCTNDFVVTGTGLAGSSTQATIIGYRNLYSNPSGTGSCPGTGPSVLFSYNLGGVTVRHAAVLSLDGTKIAFVDTAGGFHVLRWSSAAGNGTAINAPATPGVGNTAVDTRLTLATGIGSPFIDYSADVAYVTTGSGTGLVRKIANVFNGTPTEVTTGGWPVSMPVTNLSTPVLDFVTKRLFVTGNGTIYFIDTTATTVSRSSTTYAFATASISYPVTIDSTNQRIYAWSPSNGTNAVMVQADTALSSASRVLVTLGGTMTASPLGGDFNSSYYNGNATAGRLYVVGNDGTTNKVPSLFAFSFNSAWRMNGTATNGPLRLATNVSGLEASFVTSFFNQTQNKDYLFVGVTNNCSTAVTTGCIRSIDVTGGAFPTATSVNNVILGATGGTYGIAIDNNSSAAEASSVYYVVRGTNQLVKATQAALN